MVCVAQERGTWHGTPGAPASYCTCMTVLRWYIVEDNAPYAALLSRLALVSTVHLPFLPLQSAAPLPPARFSKRPDLGRAGGVVPPVRQAPAVPLAPEPNRQRPVLGAVVRPQPYIRRAAPAHAPGGQAGGGGVVGAGGGCAVAAAGRWGAGAGAGGGGAGGRRAARGLAGERCTCASSAPY